MGLKLITGPSLVPVTLAELRTQVNWPDDDTTHDARLSSLAADACETIERYTRRAMISQVWRWTTGVARIFALPRPPLISVSSVKVYDTESVATTLTEGTDFEVLSNGSPGIVRMLDSYTFSGYRDTEPVEINYTAGYGTGAEAVPFGLREAILQLVTMNFEHRGDTMMEMPMHLKAKLDGLRSGTVAGYYSEQI